MARDHEKALVLFVAAEPRGENPILLGREFRDIIEEIERKGPNRGLEFRTLWAARPIDVTRAMSDYEPVIVHFSGHGTPEGGFILESVDGSAIEIDCKAMGSIFRTYKKRVKIVVLNSCYSVPLAEKISRSVDVVIGMEGKIGIKAAFHFSVGFYRGIVARESVQQCFQMAKTELDMEMTQESHSPVLYARPGVEAYKVFVLNPDLDPRRWPSSPGAQAQHFQGSPTIHSEHGISITVGDGTTDRRGPKLVELALGGISGAVAERCLEVMIRSHRGADRLEESSADDGWSRDEVGVQRDDSGQLTALHGVPVRQYDEAEPWQLATELGNRHSVLIGTGPHEDWSQNQIFQDLGATTPILLSRLEAGDSGPTRVVVIAPGSEKEGAEYPIGHFLDAWSASRFFMVATQEPPRVEFQIPRESGIRRTTDNHLVEEAILDGLQDAAPEALEEGVFSRFDLQEVSHGEGQNLQNPSGPDPHDQVPNPFTEGLPEQSMSTYYLVDRIGTDSDEDPPAESFGDHDLL